MVATLEIATRSLLDRTTHTVATCWRIARSDGTIYRFTDFHQALTIFDKQAYTPASAGESTARRKQSGLEDATAEYSGGITSDAITEQDLEQGKFDDAEVLEYIVDWRHPWVKPIRTSRYYLGSIVFTGEVWRAEVTGIPSWFKQPIGRVYGRGCDEILGGPRCGVNLSSFSTSFSVDTVINIRDGFTDSGISSGFEDDAFTGGQIVWIDGQNSGTISEVKKFVNTGNIVTLFLPTSFPIEVGDTGTMYRGCLHTKAACKDTFSNLVNFQGFPTIPGTDKMLKQP